MWCVVWCVVCGLWCGVWCGVEGGVECSVVCTGECNVEYSVVCCVRCGVAAKGCLKIIKHIEPNIKLEITKRVCKVRLINVFSQESGTNSKNVLGKKWREFCLQVRAWVLAAPTTNIAKYFARHF